MLRVSLTNDQQHTDFSHDQGPLELGRGPRRDLARLVVKDLSVSRDHLRVTQRGEGSVLLENLSTKQPVRVSGFGVIKASESLVIGLPVFIAIGRTSVEIMSDDFPDRPTGASEPASIRSITISGAKTAAALASLGESPAPIELARWFETLFEVLESAADSNEFYQSAARAIVDLIGLDIGLVLMRKGNDWQTVGSFSRNGGENASISRTVLREVVRQKITLYEPPRAFSDSESLRDLNAVVASPIMRYEEVSGVVYGSRFQSQGTRGSEVTPLESQFVQLLAAAVATGAARREREVEAAQAQARFEQFVPPEVARQLRDRPDLLEGAEREVSVFFCDVRGFSRIAEELGPAQTYRWMSDLMDSFTDCVLQHEGTVVDYYGDGLLAMWNAPTDQPDHACRAASAAIEIVERLPSLNDHWRKTISSSIDVGIGLHTGVARVGNTGSHRRLKYGPRGHVVNLTSRVEGATKHFGVRVLATGEFRQLLSGDFLTRRLGFVRLAGLGCRTELFELLANEGGRPEWMNQFEQGLKFFEERNLEVAYKHFEECRQAEGTDRPSVIMCSRIDVAKASNADFDPTWILEQK